MTVQENSATITSETETLPQGIGVEIDNPKYDS